MALEDFVDPEVGIAVAVTALAASPRARNIVRGGMVYGLAGLFKLGGVMSTAAQGAVDSAQHMAANAGTAAQGVVGEARNEASTGHGTPTEAEAETGV